MNHSDFVQRYLKGVGTEIGAFTSPVPGIQPIYVDKFVEFAGERCLGDYFGDAVDLPFVDRSLDYVVASHVLEHCANPIKALGEWFRVLKPGGIAYVVVPDKRYTWDRNRNETPLSHMIDDFESGVTDCDDTHIDDFIYGVEWSEIQPDCKASETESQRKAHSEHYKERVAKGEEINIHFHVFSPQNFRALATEASSAHRIPYRWEIEILEERFPEDCPHGILAVLRKKENRQPFHRIRHFMNKQTNARYPLRKNAKAFPPATQ